MGELGRLVSEYRDRQKYPVSDAQIARAIGVSRSSVGNWIKGSSLPSPAHVRALAHHIEIAYTRVLEAALADAGYLPKGRDGDDDAAPTIDLAWPSPSAEEDAPVAPGGSEPPGGPASAADTAPRRGPKLVPPAEHRARKTRSTGRRGTGHS